MVADKFGASDKIFAQFRLEKKPYYPVLKNPTLDSVVAAASQLNQITRFKVSPEERGIVLFEAARRALASAEAAGLASPYHEPRFDDPPELYPGDEDELPDAAFAD
jgi:intracellular multiplication protein IcmO